MTLELEITSYQRLSPAIEVKKIFAPKIQTIGRSAECYWQLPDPDRAVSSTHAQIDWRKGQYWLRDTSTNGVYINDSEQALGRDQEVAIQANDHFRIGDYEIAVRISAPVAKLQKSTNTVINVTEGTRFITKKAAKPTSFETAKQPDLQAGMHASSISTLSEYDLIDSHINLPEPIPTDWNWHEPESESSPQQTATVHHRYLVDTLLHSMGVDNFFSNAEPDTHFMVELGTLVRVLLDNLIDLLHRRAEQKQQLRVQQTTFKRAENNPLKFSTNSQDAIEALLLKRHPSFLSSEQAIKEAFVNIQSHEKALLAGVESVISELLREPKKPSGGINRWPVIGKALAYERSNMLREHNRNEYNDINRLLRSDLFIEAYEQTIRDEKENAC